MNLLEVIAYSLGFSDTSLIVRFLLLIFFILLFSIAFAKMHIFKNNKPIAILVPIVLALLVTYYLSQDFIERYIFSSYQTFGLLLIIIIPFVLLMYVLHRTKMSSIGRRIVWVIAAVLFAVYLFQTYQGLTPGELRVYIAGAVLILIGIVFDKPLNNLLRKRDN